MHVIENRSYWDARAHDWVAAGERSWALDEPAWGVWGVSEAELGLLPADMRGLRAIELGCGTGYVSGWMARRGATVTAIDNSAEQLATARRLADQYGAEITFLHGDAERVALPEGSFDFAISEYGAAIWCDPRVWIPEAHRLLTPGGRLVFLGNHPLVTACTPPDGSPVSERLVRPYFGQHASDWTQAAVDPGGIEFNLTISDWFALFGAVGFTVEGYLEPRPSQGGSEVRFFATADWARRYPSEQVWKLRKAP
ncbi:MAG TPA: class I SAM-dependent methyltransferase [Candidatus Limnocylindrales bacterium]|nr:class I SAM-dependent methyltransferase [Candidatus Limnocylindrales bacterium]